MSGKSIPSSLASIALMGALNLFLFAALAENALAQAPARPLRPEPCWQVAGVTKSALQERRVIAQQARQEIAKVCANSSLSPGQKRRDIQQIHQRERQQIEAVITPVQQEAMRSCQEQRNPKHGGSHVAGGHGSGPCGQSPPVHNPNSNSDDEPPPPGAP